MKKQKPEKPSAPKLKKVAAPKKLKTKLSSMADEIGDEYADEFSALDEAPSSLPESGDRSVQKGRVVEFTWASFDRHVQLLADAVRKYKPQAIIGLVHGGVFVGGALAKALKIEFFPIRVTARSRDRKNDKEILDDMPASVEGLRVLVVDDVASSGDSLEFATRLAKARKAKAVKTASLLIKTKKYVPDFWLLQSDVFHVFPWDYDADNSFDE